MELIIHNPQDKIHTRRERKATLENEISLLGFYASELEVKFGRQDLAA